MMELSWCFVVGGEGRLHDANCSVFPCLFFLFVLHLICLGNEMQMNADYLHVSVNSGAPSSPLPSCHRFTANRGRPKVRLVWFN